MEDIFQDLQVMPGNLYSTESYIQNDFSYAYIPMIKLTYKLGTEEIINKNK